MDASTETETIIEQLANIVRKSGGVINSSEIQDVRSTDDVINIVLKWFMYQTYFSSLMMYGNKPNLGLLW